MLWGILRLLHKLRGQQPPTHMSTWGAPLLSVLCTEALRRTLWTRFQVLREESINQTTASKFQNAQLGCKLLTVYRSKKLERVQMFFTIGVWGKKMEAGFGEIMYSPLCPCQRKKERKEIEYWIVYKEWGESTCINMVGRKVWGQRPNFIDQQKSKLKNIGEVTFPFLTWGLVGLHVYTRI